MIPKKIHYCWYGHQEYPELISTCIDSWSKHLKGYEFIRWDESNTEFDNPWLKKALSEKKYAFVADYVRFRALYIHGGIYLDTDMLLLKSLDPLLEHSCFAGFEDHTHINTAIIGVEPGHPLLKKILDAYTPLFGAKDFKVITSVVTPIFQEYMKEMNPEKISTYLGLTVYPPTYFYPVPYSEKNVLATFQSYIGPNSYAAHLWYKSWYDEFSYFSIQEFRKGFRILFKKLKENPFQSFSYYRFLFFSLYTNYKKHLTRSEKK